MTWKYEQRIDTIDGTQVPREYLHNSERDALVHGSWSRGWRFEYTRKDLYFRFYASPDYKRYPKRLQQLRELDRGLGPACTVFLDKKDLTKLLADATYHLIAADIKSALKSHWQLVTAVPPPIEQVAFSNKELELLSD